MGEISQQIGETKLPLSPSHLRLNLDPLHSGRSSVADRALLVVIALTYCMFRPGGTTWLASLLPFATWCAYKCCPSAAMSWWSFRLTWVDCPSRCPGVGSTCTAHRACSPHLLCYPCLPQLPPSGFLVSSWQGCPATMFCEMLSLCLRAHVAGWRRCLPTATDCPPSPAPSLRARP